MLISEVTLWYFGGSVQRLPIPEHAELFGRLVHRAEEDLVPALYQRRYYEDYFLLSRYFKPRSILEIGTRFGYSLIAMCQGALPTRIVSIDMECYESRFDAPTQVIARRNMSACIGDAADRQFIVGNSHQVQISETFDMIHVDGDHSQDGARDDIVKYFDNLAPGGIMLVDDLDQPAVLAGVKLAIAALGLPPDRVAFHAHKHGLALLKK